MRVNFTLKSAQTKLILSKKPHEITYDLTAYDTPGIGDSQGRSKTFLNDIAQTIQTTPMNMIIVLVEYGKHDVNFFNNLDVLRECLNDLSQCTTILIVNKVPTKVYFENKLRRGEHVPNRDEELEVTFGKLASVLGGGGGGGDGLNSFKYQFYLENDDFDSEINHEKYNSIRQVIFKCSTHLNTSRVRTWTQVAEFYEREIATLTDEEIHRSINELKRDLEDKLEKVEFDMADIKYSYLDCIELLTFDLGQGNDETFEFVSTYECKISKEEYYLKIKCSNDYGEYIQNRMLILKTEMSPMVEYMASLSGTSIGVAAVAGATLATMMGPALFGLITVGLASVSYMSLLDSNVVEKLKGLGARRTVLRNELEKSQCSIEERKKMLVEKRERIARLETSLVNPNQISA